MVSAPLLFKVLINCDNLLFYLKTVLMLEKNFYRLPTIRHIPTSIPPDIVFVLNYFERQRKGMHYVKAAQKVMVSIQSVKIHIYVSRYLM